MLQTLPLVMFIEMEDLSIGAFAVLFVLDCSNEVKRRFLITYGLIYIVLTGLTYLFQQGFSTPEQLNTFNQLDKAWTGYEALPLLLFLVLMLPYNVLLWIDKQAGARNKREERKRTSTVRLLRLAMGGLIVLTGPAKLFFIASVYQPHSVFHYATEFLLVKFF